MVEQQKIRVLVIDDSAYNRKALADFANAEPDIEVVATACDGEEGLLLAMRENPDVITLDLEMPRMDGFAFLRILMAKKPIPVIVISTHTEKEKIFRALELGALDFVSKPTHRISPAIKEIQGEVVKKIRLARTLHTESLFPAVPFSADSAPPSTIKTDFPPSPVISRMPPTMAPPRLTDQERQLFAQEKKIDPAEKFAALKQRKAATRFIAIAASTGGPAALTQILTALPDDFGAGIIIVQHMPPRFTTTFADRLNKQCRIYVEEVTGSALVRVGAAYIAPGQSCLEVTKSESGLFVVATAPTERDRYVPSADRMFHSIAASLGREVLGVVLTGMGDDGSRGVVDLARAGARIVVEDAATAVIPGMPQAVINTGVAEQVLPLKQIAAFLTRFAAERG